MIAVGLALQNERTPWEVVDSICKYQPTKETLYRSRLDHGWILLRSGCSVRGWFHGNQKTPEAKYAVILSHLKSKMN
ncbi:hypothetical protein NC651_006370 [Populus alba x Populus x berolinensis]|nr:hypothetical protein NC651_006370 [Populus alba x Populus x berolinensis]